jgi:hypothetical protein
MTFDVLMAATQGSADSTDVPARIIAAWGAVVATVVLALQLVRFRRERPRLKVRADAETRMDGSSIRIQVVNPPLAPAVTVMQVGLMATENATVAVVEDKDGNKIEGDSNADIPVRSSFLFHSSEPLLISEGEAKVFRVNLESMPFTVREDGDEEFRAFARDAEGRLMRGNKGRFFYRALEAGWKPKPRHPAHPLQTSSMMLLPEFGLKRWWWQWKHR